MRNNKVNQETTHLNTTKENGLDAKLLCSATESVLNMIIDCTKEQDPSVQVERARAIEMLTDALVKFNFKIIS